MGRGRGLVTAPRTSPDDIPAPPTVTSIRATVKHPRGRHRDVYEVAWLPSEGWWCTCAAWTARTGCTHVTAVTNTITSREDTP